MSVGRGSAGAPPGERSYLISPGQDGRMAVPWLSGDAMQSQRGPRSESSKGNRVRYLLLGLIIGAATIVLLTNNNASFGTASAVEQAMPSASSLPGAITSAVSPRNAGERIPEVDVSRLPKAADSAAPVASGAAKRGGKSAKKRDGEGDDKKAAAPRTPPADDTMGVPSGFEQILDSLQDFGKAFKSDN